MFIFKHSSNRCPFLHKRSEWIYPPRTPKRSRIVMYDTIQFLKIPVWKWETNDVKVLRHQMASQYQKSTAHYNQNPTSIYHSETFRKSLGGWISSSKTELSRDIYLPLVLTLRILAEHVNIDGDLCCGHVCVYTIKTINMLLILSP